jgi:hypothetical protein
VPGRRGKRSVERSQLRLPRQPADGERVRNCAHVLAQLVDGVQGAANVVAGQARLGQPELKIGVSADQLDGGALAPVQGVDELDEQRLHARPFVRPGRLECDRRDRVIIGALLAVRPSWPGASVVGSLGATIAFLMTLSFCSPCPNLSPEWQCFLMKDLIGGCCRVGGGRRDHAGQGKDCFARL